MAEDRNSFDPKTWAGSARTGKVVPDRPGSAGADPGGNGSGTVTQSAADGSSRIGDDGSTTSFDPKTWVRPGSSAKAKETSKEAEPANTARPRLFAAAGILTAVIAFGGLTAFWLGADEPVGAEGETPAPAANPAPATVTAADAPEGQSRAATASRVIDVAGLNELEEQLITIGIDPQAALEISRETGLALGSDSPMRIELDMLESDAGLRFNALLAELRDGTAIRLSSRADGGFAREEVIATASTTVKVISAEMTHVTFYDSVVAKGLPDELVSDAVKVFAFDFNFQKGIPSDSRFRIAWEEKVTQTGRSLEPPRLLFVELEAQGEQHSYYSFVPPGEQEPQWFDENGQGNASLLMQTPIDGARITSNFGKRLHPITKRQKAHNGVDFAAPKGTPIYAAGDAKVAFAAPRGSAGNFVRLDHGNGLQTWYMHLDAFADGLVPGLEVRQGEVIGYVGTTGGSTGDHLHYEIRVNGTPVPPLEFEFAQEEMLEGRTLAMFEGRRDTTQAEMRFAESRGGSDLAMTR